MRKPLGLAPPPPHHLLTHAPQHALHEADEGFRDYDLGLEPRRLVRRAGAPAVPRRVQAEGERSLVGRLKVDAPLRDARPAAQRRAPRAHPSGLGTVEDSSRLAHHSKHRGRVTRPAPCAEARRLALGVVTRRRDGGRRLAPGEGASRRSILVRRGRDGEAISGRAARGGAGAEESPRRVHGAPLSRLPQGGRKLEAPLVGATALGKVGCLDRPRVEGGASAALLEHAGEQSEGLTRAHAALTGLNPRVEA